MSSPAPRRGLRTLALLAATTLLASCTVGGDDPDDAATDAAVAPVTSPPSGPDTASARPSPEGPSPQELNDDILASAIEAAEAEPLASVTGVVTPEDVETVLDVLEVRAVTEGTLVRMRLSSSSGEFNVGATTFAGDRFGTQSFVRDVYLDDTAGGTRYLPLQFQDYRAACICPYIPLGVGAVPQEVHALFPALPEGATVDLRLADSDLVVAGLTVDG